VPNNKLLQIIWPYFRNWAVALLYLKQYDEAERAIKEAIEKQEPDESMDYIKVNRKLGCSRKNIGSKR
jgi:hypothetical protein